MHLGREVLVTALVGQRPFEMCYLAPGAMISLIKGAAVSEPNFLILEWLLSCSPFENLKSGVDDGWRGRARRV